MLRLLGLAIAGWLGGGPAVAQTAAITHHCDISRSGWNATETVLTLASVGATGSFGLLTSVTLDGIVDAQPLVVPGVVIAGAPNAGKHDVVYVATENNSLYAIDPTAGTILPHRNFGTIMPRTRGCAANDSGVGITGTPVIDLQRQLLYVVVYTRDGPPGGALKATYRLHALNLATLQDAMTPLVITATQALEDGTILAFPPGLERQRPALLEYNDTVYTGFGSFCDNAPARGWIMGWSAATLQPLNPGATGKLVGALMNRETSEPSGHFLSAIWMSGAGPAADMTGVYYVTGNSDKNVSQYDPVYNPEHSVIRLSLDTTTVLGLFTPSNLPYLATNDRDFGAGGEILLPSTASGQPPMVAATGKVCRPGMPITSSGLPMATTGSAAPRVSAARPGIPASSITTQRRSIPSANNRPRSPGRSRPDRP